jgi:hypothetical protein
MYHPPLYAFSFSSPPAYIHLILLEYHPAVLIKPFPCYRSRSSRSSASPPSSSSYQRRDRRRHPTGHLFRVVRWSSRSPQRHPHPTIRWKCTFLLSPRLCDFPSASFYHTRVFVCCGRDIPSAFLLSQYIIYGRHGASVSAPFLSQPSPVTFST